MTHTQEFFPLKRSAINFSWSFQESLRLCSFLGFVDFSDGYFFAYLQFHSVKGCNCGNSGFFVRCILFRRRVRCKSFSFQNGWLLPFQVLLRQQFLLLLWGSCVLSMGFHLVSSRTKSRSLTPWNCSSMPSKYSVSAVYPIVPTSGMFELEANCFGVCVSSLGGNRFLILPTLKVDAWLQTYCLFYHVLVIQRDCGSSFGRFQYRIVWGAATRFLVF